MQNEKLPKLREGRCPRDKGFSMRHLLGRFQKKRNHGAAPLA